MSATLNPQQEKLIKKSYKDFSSKGEMIISAFVQKMNQVDPDSAQKFPENQAQLETFITDAVKQVAQNATKLNTIEPQLVTFAQQFFGFGLSQEQFGVVCDSLVDTFAEVAGQSWNPQTDEAWRCAFQGVVQIVREADPVKQAA